MATVRGHLKAMHTANADFHVQAAKTHSKIAKCFGKSDVEGAEDLTAAHEELAKAHADAAENCVQCCKSLDMGKAVGGDGDEIVPDRVSMIYKNDYPNLRAIPRTGAPQVSHELVDVSGVDPALQKFVSVDDSID